MVFLHKNKRIINWKFHPFSEEIEEYEEKVKIFFCDNSGEKKTLEEGCVESFKEIGFEFTSPGTL